MDECKLQYGKESREMFRGDSFVFEVNVLQADCAPQNITGWSMWFTAKYFVADYDTQAPIKLGTISPLSGITFTNALAGQAEVTIPSVATAGFPDTPTKLVYDVQVKDTTGRVFTIETGTLTVNPDVTRATS